MSKNKRTELRKRKVRLILFASSIDIINQQTEMLVSRCYPNAVVSLPYPCDRGEFVGGCRVYLDVLIDGNTSNGEEEDTRT